MGFRASGFFLVYLLICYTEKLQSSQFCHLDVNHLLLTLFVPGLDWSLFLNTFFFNLVIDFHLSWGMGNSDEDEGKSLPRGWSDMRAVLRREGKLHLRRVLSLLDNALSNPTDSPTWDRGWTGDLKGPFTAWFCCRALWEKRKAHLKTSVRCYR